MDLKHYQEKHKPSSRAEEILRYIGPGLLITVGFIDPGNWASNLAAGADYGYLLLWMVTLSTIMLILLQLSPPLATQLSVLSLLARKLTPHLCILLLSSK